MAKASENFSLINLTKAKLPRLAFAAMKEAVLGDKYELSVTIVSKKRIQELNRQYRNINEPTDILSFPLDEVGGENGHTTGSGEIFINLDCAKEEAKKFERDYENFLGFLFIHGLVHLKGYDHGSTMEELERRFRGQFSI